MTRSVHDVIWGYTDPWLNMPFFQTLAPGKSFIQLQTNNTPPIWQNVSEQYTGKVCCRGREGGSLALRSSVPLILPFSFPALRAS